MVSSAPLQRARHSRIPRLPSPPILYSGAPPAPLARKGKLQALGPHGDVLRPEVKALSCRLDAITHNAHMCGAARECATAWIIVVENRRARGWQRFDELVLRGLDVVDGLKALQVLGSDGR